jgi:hypothetical protein
MRKEWLIVAGVLVPFAALVAVALYGSPEGAVATSKVSPSTPPLPERPSEVAMRGASDSGAAEPIAPALEAPIRAVSPEVHACFIDNGMHLHGRIAVTVAFTPTIDGALTQVSVQTPIANPELTACLEDVFAELHFAPTGRERFEPTKYTFVFDAPP